MPRTQKRLSPRIGKWPNRKLRRVFKNSSLPSVYWVSEPSLLNTTDRVKRSSLVRRKKKIPTSDLSNAKTRTNFRMQVVGKQTGAWWVWNYHQTMTCICQRGGLCKPRREKRADTSLLKHKRFRVGLGRKLWLERTTLTERVLKSGTLGQIKVSRPHRPRWHCQSIRFT